jgi:hypothetical protein
MASKFGDRALPEQAIRYNPDLPLGRKFRRVWHLISFTCLSADPLGPVLVLISYPLKDRDESQTPPWQNNLICLKGRDRV